MPTATSVTSYATVDAGAARTAAELQAYSDAQLANVLGYVADLNEANVANQDRDINLAALKLWIQSFASSDGRNYPSIARGNATRGTPATFGEVGLANAGQINFGDRVVVRLSDGTREINIAVSGAFAIDETIEPPQTPTGTIYDIEPATVASATVAPSVADVNADANYTGVTAFALGDRVNRLIPAGTTGATEGTLQVWTALTAGTLTLTQTRTPGDGEATTFVTAAPANNAGNAGDQFIGQSGTALAGIIWEQQANGTQTIVGQIEASRDTVLAAGDVTTVQTALSGSGFTYRYQLLTQDGSNTPGVWEVDEFNHVQTGFSSGVTGGGSAYTHPNHSGDVVSVGDGATTIQANAVSGAKIADDGVQIARTMDWAGNASATQDIADGAAVNVDLSTEGMAYLRLAGAVTLNAVNHQMSKSKSVRLFNPTTGAAAITYAGSVGFSAPTEVPAGEYLTLQYQGTRDNADNAVIEVQPTNQAGTI